LEAHPLVPVKSKRARQETVIPALKAWGSPSKDLLISLLPDFPGSHGEDFHEEVIGEVLLCFLDGVEEMKVMVPGDLKTVPTFIAKGTLEN
jgi:hypothetical protein